MAPGAHELDKWVRFTEAEGRRGCSKNKWGVHMLGREGTGDGNMLSWFKQKMSVKAHTHTQHTDTHNVVGRGQSPGTWKSHPRLRWMPHPEYFPKYRIIWCQFKSKNSWTEAVLLLLKYVSYLPLQKIIQAHSIKLEKYKKKYKRNTSRTVISCLSMFSRKLQLSIKRWLCLES